MLKDLINLKISHNQTAFSKDDIANEENEIVHDSLEKTSNLVIVPKKVILWDRYSSWQKGLRNIYIDLITRHWKLKKS